MTKKKPTSKEPTLKELARIVKGHEKELDIIVNSQNKTRISLRKSLDITRRELRSVSARVKKISPHEIEGKLDVLEPRIEMLNRSYALLIEKHTVITEVCFWVRMAHPDLSGNNAEACIWAVDAMDNDWWNVKTGLTIKQWHKAITNAYSDYLEVSKERKILERMPAARKR